MSKIWKAVEILYVAKILERYEDHEEEFIVNLMYNLNPKNPEEELSRDQIQFIKEIYKKYIFIDFK